MYTPKTPQNLARLVHTVDCKFQSYRRRQATYTFLQAVGTHAVGRFVLAAGCASYTVYFISIRYVNVCEIFKNIFQGKY